MHRDLDLAQYQAQLAAMPYVENDRGSPQDSLSRLIEEIIRLREDLGHASAWARFHLEDARRERKRRMVPIGRKKPTAAPEQRPGLRADAVDEWDGAIAGFPSTPTHLVSGRCAYCHNASYTGVLSFDPDESAIKVAVCPAHLYQLARRGIDAAEALKEAMAESESGINSE